MAISLFEFFALGGRFAYHSVGEAGNASYIDTKARWAGPRSQLVQVDESVAFMIDSVVHPGDCNLALPHRLSILALKGVIVG